jgi:hypothetical protein
MGISFTIMSSSVFPSIPLTVEENSLGTAYGFQASLQNLGVASIGTAIGYVIDYWGFFKQELINICSLLICSICISILYFVDTVKNGKLNKPVEP